MNNVSVSSCTPFNQQTGSTLGQGAGVCVLRAVYVGRVLCL